MEGAVVHGPDVATLSWGFGRSGIEECIALGRALAQIVAWRRGTDTPEVAYEVRLIGVSRLVRKDGPIHLFVLPQLLERPQESLQLRVRFRRQPEISGECRGQVLSADVQRFVKLAHTNVAMCGFDTGGRFTNERRTPLNR